MKGPSVLFPISSTGIGGANVLPARLVEHLRHGSTWDARVCLSSRGANATLFEVNGFRPDYLGVPLVAEADQQRVLKRIRYYGAAGYLRTYRQIFPYLRQRRPDLIHIHNAHDLFTWGLAGKLLGIPVLWHVHTFHQKRLGAAHFRLCDHMVFVSEATRQHFEQMSAGARGTMVHNGVDVEPLAALACPAASRARLGVPPQRLTIGFVGQLTPRKRPDWAVRAAIDLLEQGHDLQMLVAGEDKSKDGSNHARLERMIRDAGWEDRIHLLGQRADIGELMRAMDVFLFTSEANGEAFPLVVLEAMAAATTVVSTRSAGVPEAISDRETGLLARPDDYRHFLERATEAVSDAGLRRRLAAAAHREALARFTIERCADRVVDVYDGMMVRSRQPRAT